MLRERNCQFERFAILFGSFKILKEFLTIQNWLEDAKTFFFTFLFTRINFVSSGMAKHSMSLDTFRAYHFYFFVKLNWLKRIRVEKCCRKSSEHFFVLKSKIRSDVNSDSEWHAHREPCANREKRATLSTRKRCKKQLEVVKCVK